MLSRRLYQICFISLLIYTSFICISHINSRAVSFVDELLFEEASFRMAVTNQYLTPVINNYVWLEKPPLYFWITATVFKVADYINPQAKYLDVSSSLDSENIYRYPWIRRICTTIAAVTTVAATIALASFVFSPIVGILSGFILTTTPLFIYSALSGSLDITATCLISVAFFLYSQLHSHHPRSPAKPALLGIIAGLAFLTRSFLALTPLVIITLHQLLLPPSRRLSLGSYLTIWIAFLIVILPWHLYSLFHYPSIFISTYLGFNLVKHALTLTPGYSPTHPFFYISLFLTQNPWVYFLILGSFLHVRHGKKLPLPSPIALWFILPLAVFSLSTTRHEWYVIQLLPPLSILSGFFLHRFLLFLNLPTRVVARYLAYLFLISYFIVIPLAPAVSLPASPPLAQNLWSVVQLSSPDQTVFSLDHPYFPRTLLFRPRSTQIISISKLNQTASDNHPFFLFMTDAQSNLVKNILPQLQHGKLTPGVANLYYLP